MGVAKIFPSIDFVEFGQYGLSEGKAYLMSGNLQKQEKKGKRKKERINRDGDLCTIFHFFPLF